jgi:ubiquinone/menaquinone biosynthesis C-methylase UbiE
MDAKELSQDRFGKYAASYVASRNHAGGPDLERLAQLAGHHPGWVALDIATGGGHTALAVAPHVARVVATDITEPMLAAAREFIQASGATIGLLKSDASPPGCDGHAREKDAGSANSGAICATEDTLSYRPVLSGGRGFALQQPSTVEFQEADAEDLPFAACSFDLVTCRIAAHHFPHPARFVAEVVRVLQPGGLFLLQDQVTPEDPGTAAWITDFEKRRDPSHQRALSPAEWLALLASSGLSVETDDRFEKRLSLVKWAAAQEGTAEDLADLRARLRRAPSAVRDWMRPTDIETGEAKFSIHHCLFSARKTGLGDLGAGC